MISNQCRHPKICGKSHRDVSHFCLDLALAKSAFEWLAITVFPSRKLGVIPASRKRTAVGFWCLTIRQETARKLYSRHPLCWKYPNNSNVFQRSISILFLTIARSSSKQKFLPISLHDVQLGLHCTSFWSRKSKKQAFRWKLEKLVQKWMTSEWSKLRLSMVTWYN